MADKRIVFTEPGQVELQDFTFDADDLAPNQVAIQTHYSLISPGTELACLSGTEPWARLPFVPGYSGCGEVIAVGAAVQAFRPGDLVFAYTKHASRVVTDRLVFALPHGMEERLVPFIRMAAVGMTAVRVSQAELGDRVAVLGMGLVGNLCAQLFGLAGCEVIGIDLSASRLERARRCGIAHQIQAAEADVPARVREITGGEMCQVVVEATGLPEVAESAPALAAKLGEVILLGSPRREHTSDITPLLQAVHLWGEGCVTLKGAHEWRYPAQRDPDGRVKHSIERNVDILFRLLAEGRLHVEELLTHLLPPEEAPQAYRGLRERPDEYLGVVFDWTETSR